MVNLLEIQNLLRDHFKTYITTQKANELKVFLQHEFNKNDPASIEHVPAIHLIVRSSRITDITLNGQSKKLVIRVTMEAIIATRNLSTQSIGKASIENLGNYLSLVYTALLDFRHKDYTLDFNALKDTDHKLMFAEKTNNAFCIIPFAVITGLSYDNLTGKNNG
jgi:hypothetical protein